MGRQRLSLSIAHMSEAVSCSELWRPKAKDQMSDEATAAAGNYDKNAQDEEEEEESGIWYP